MISSSNEIILTNTSIVLSDRVIRGSIKIEDAHIKEINEEATHIKTAIDLEDYFFKTRFSRVTYR